MDRPLHVDDIVLRVQLAGHALPSLDQLNEYAQACDRDLSVMPILQPDVYRRAEKRLPALRDAMRAAAKFRAAFDALEAAAAEESDPELDRAAQTLADGLTRRMRAQREAANG